MRDAYGTAVELPHLAKWAAGEPDDLEWLQGWCSSLRGHVAADRTVRRARIVSEPLSEYQRWSHSIAQPMVDAGEDIRWVSRRLVSSIPLPGNDFYLLDDGLVVFLHYAGNGLGTAKTSAYCAAMLSFWIEFLGTSNDLDEAVAVRMNRQQVLYRRDKRFHVVLEEQALRTWFGTAEMQLGQLDRLLALMSLPNVSFGRRSVNHDFPRRQRGKPSVNSRAQNGAGSSGSGGKGFRPSHSAVITWGSWGGGGFAVGEGGGPSPGR